LKDFYAILGVDKNANEKQIKSEYRKLAKKFHPDKNPDNDDTAERFKEVSEAYGVLGDPEKRQEYDMMLQGGGFRPHNSFEDLFSSFGFNPFDPFSRSNQQQPRSPPQSKIVLEMTTNELFAGGKDMSVKVRVTKKCKPCAGKGGDYAEVCTGCAGTGQTQKLEHHGPMVIKTSKTCSLCHGRGQLISGICHTCEGNGKIKVVEEYRIDITTTKIS
jgi:DnaJ-class molecular chaperone